MRSAPATISRLDRVLSVRVAEDGQARIEPVAAGSV
jgi:hypothetical protein